MKYSLSKLVTALFCFAILSTTVVQAQDPQQYQASVYGFMGSDPHVTPWGNNMGRSFDIPASKGGEDYILLSNPDYADGLGLEIQIRTQVNDHWSFVRAVGIRIGDETFEIEASASDYTAAPRYWVNGKEHDTADTITSFASNVVAADMLPLNSKQYRFEADLSIFEGDKIVVETFGPYCRVDMYTYGSFDSHSGLLGTFPQGIKLGRDESTIFGDDDGEAFAQEWKVVPAQDGTLFHATAATSARSSNSRLSRASA